MVMKNPPGSEGGVSELVGSILMIAVLVMAVSIAGIYLLSQPRPEKIPSLHATIWNDTQKIYLSHDGGDPLDYNYIKIYVDGIDKTSSFFMSTATGQPWTTWSIGNVLVYVTGSSPVSTVHVVYTGTGSSAVGLATLYVGPVAGGGVAPNPVTASFSGSPTSGFVPFNVQFTDASTGPVISWLWSFGDGGISTEQSPLHTYSSPNTYTVSLIVSNGDGSSTQTTTITGYLPIIADFTSTTQSGAAPLPVSFTDVSSNTPTSWKWEYRNATVGWTQFGTTQNPSFTFPSGIYSINLTASNAGGSDYETKNNYITVTPSPPWYCGWGYRKNITIDKSRVSGAQTDFPVLINLASDADLSASARSDGYDLLFTSSDGTTKLSHEIESYRSGTGALVAWVKVPSITSSSNTTIYMYYGCATATNQQNKNNVWDTNYRAVWHLNETGIGTRFDSTINANNANPRNYDGNEATTGKIGGADYFEGTNDYLDSSNTIGITGNAVRTITFWANLGNTNRNGMVVWGTNFANFQFGASVRPTPGNYFLWGYGAGNDWDTGILPATASWHHHAVINDGTTGRWYVDGVQLGSGFTPPHTYATTDSLVSIGREVDGATISYMTGTIDEVRISNVVRSLSWITTEYNNQNSPATFHYVMGQEQWTC